MKFKLSVSIRMPSGRFPPGSYAAALRPAKADLERDSLRAFADAKDPATGKPWAPRKQPYPWPPLMKTLALYRGVIKAIASATLTGSTLTVRYDVPRHWRFHQDGTKKMKRRRVVAVSKQTKRALARRLKGEGVRLIGTKRGR